jgi:hypothetical protein
MEEIVPAIETIAVPPAPIRGWYPNPSDEPTDTIIPPIGRFEVLASDVAEIPVPTKLIDVIPVFSDKVYAADNPGDWKMSFINIIAFSLDIPDTLEPFDFRVKSF